MLPNYVLLDLETTGATPIRDRITEIALVRFVNGVEVNRWQTLVNPEVSIPSFIQQLTGINNEMVAAAPTFKQVAAELLDHIQGAILCAHNVRFDHGFLKSEFKRIGIDLRQKVLCTVKLSRKLYPQHRSHGLDAIMTRHGLATISRHRAMSDVDLMIGFLQSAQRELGLEKIASTASELLKGPTVPAGVDAAILDDMPEAPGVYLFFGDSELPLYIGKSVNIKARVLSHFSGDHSSAKEMRIGQEIKHVEWIETAGEFGALLLESKLVKERQPIFNKRLRREKQLCSWKIASSINESPLLSLVKEGEIHPATIGHLFGTFRSKRQAIEVLRTIVETHALCPKAVGLEAGKGACFSHQLRRCKGVCAGKEKPEIHFLRLQQAMAAHRLISWPYPGMIGIREQNQMNGATELHVFQNWCHLATIKDESELSNLIQAKENLAFDLDTYKLLLKQLGKPGYTLVHL